MPGISAFPPPGSVKSIQAGTITMTSAQTTNTATVTAFNTASYVLTYLGCDVSTNNAECFGSIVVTNSTTLTVTRGNIGGGSVTTNVRYQLTEYN